MVLIRGHARNWRTYFACGGLGLAFLILATKSDTFDEEHNARRKNNASNNLNKKVTPGHIYKDYDHPSEGEHRTAEQFIWKEQKAISVWTLRAAVIAAGLSLGSVIYTAKQVDVSRQTLILSERSFVTFHGMSQSAGVYSGQPFTYWTPNFENSGATPTVGLLVWTICSFAAPTPSFIRPEGVYLDQTLIGPHITVATRTCGLSNSSIKSNSDVGIYPFVYGEVRYKDLFRQSHITRWCSTFAHDPFTNTIVTSGCSGDNAKYNCADDECGVPY